MYLLDNKGIKNCHLTSDDVRAAEDIFGKDLIAVQGKTTRSSAEHVKTNKVVMPAKILKRYRKITLCVDIMKVNKIPFSMSIARGIKFMTAEFISDMKDKHCVKQSNR